MAKISRYAALLFISALLFTSACAARSAGSGGSAEHKVISVVATFDALYELASAVGGDRASVVNVMPPGADAHHFEPSARDLTMLNTADVFLICGLGFEPWADSAISAAGNDTLIVCDVSSGVDPIPASGGSDADEGQMSRQHGDAGYADNADNGGSTQNGRVEQYDPHIWLSLKCAVIMAENIRDAFIEADPDGAGYYTRNCDDFTRALNGLYEEYSVKFGALHNKTLVTGHAVFAYLCRDFGLIQNSVEGVFMDGEPSARGLSQLVDFCRANNITTILAERLSSSLVAETLAAEAGASVRVIYTMENAEDGLSFLERMEQDLQVIYESLGGVVN